MKIMDSAFDLNQSIQKVIKGSDKTLKVWVLGFLDDEERLRNSSSSLNPVIVVIVVALFMKYQHINGVVIVVCYFH